ncbi:MAG: phospholipase [Phocaeicola sp.]|uniref:phospholipase n=1 Tax=Phocaeicola sp. TaxID=2773926 RepID=UPI0023C5293E|nr:phospholipase [Phocaeicola sp.]MDE5678664.1 phospholipase [Phocaeicola sp.]MDE6180945.1 phospholipase [Phocaeicola sp.]
MLILIISLIILAAIAMAVGVLHNRQIQKKIKNGELESAPEIVEADAECCGQHETCEKESLLAAVSKNIEYYDDEELDRFRGRPSDSYNDNEIEEFREIMYTCQEDEVAGWSRSLQLRGIELPDELKDELFLIVGERRFR